MMIVILLSLFFPVMMLSIAHKLLRNKLPPSPPSLPVIGHFHLLGPLIHHSFKNLSSRYGPLIYLKLGSVSCVVANTPDMARELLKHNDHVFSARKHSFAIDKLTYSSSFAFAPDGPYWKFVKKISTFELLGNRMIHRFLQIRVRELNRFLHEINSRAQACQTVNLSQELIKLSNNVISLMMFGNRSSGTMKQAEVARALVKEVTQLFGEFNISDYIWLFKNVDLQGFRKKTMNLHKKYDDFLEEIISRREKERLQHGKSNEEGNDFLDVLLGYMEDSENEVKLTRKHIKALVLDFLTAATDTTAISVEWALAELINHPVKLAKLREEISVVVGSKRIVEEGDCAKLPYLQAVVKETFRLHPPIPMIARKSMEECKVGGYDIPAGTLLFVNMWSIGRDGKYWEDPQEFRPERFADSKIDVKGQQYQFLPFGTGRRSCPGVSLAMQEVPVTVAAMVQCFEWVVPGESCILEMNERPGLTVPRFYDLTLLPASRMPDVLSTLNC